MNNMPSTKRVIPLNLQQGGKLVRIEYTNNGAHRPRRAWYPVDRVRDAMTADSSLRVVRINRKHPDDRNISHR